MAQSPPSIDIKALFEQALSLAEPGRSEWLSTLSPETAEELRALLSHHQPGEAYFSDFGQSLFAKQKTEDPLDLIGQQIGEYQITRLIGQGGMGVVYQGWDPKLDRPVAIKLLAPGHFLSEQARARFLREARMASQLEHPFIGTLYGLTQTPLGQDAMVMAFYDGQTLDKRIESETVQPQSVMRWISQLVEALRYAHQQGVLHRDIKPGNIMVMPDDSVRLLDFGAAAWLEEDGDHTGIPIGTTPYMSPEQIRAEPLTGATDYWSLGVVMLELAVALGWSQPVNAFVWAQNPAINQLRMPEAAESLLRALLALKPDQREQRVAAIQSPDFDLGRPRRRRWLTATGALMMLGAVTAGLWSQFAEREPQRLALQLGSGAHPASTVWLNQLDQKLGILAGGDEQFSYLGSTNAPQRLHGANREVVMELEAQDDSVAVRLSYLGQDGPFWQQSFSESQLSLAPVAIFNALQSQLKLPSSPKATLIQQERILDPVGYELYLEGAAKLLTFEAHRSLTHWNALMDASDSLEAALALENTALYQLSLAKASRYRFQLTHQGQWLEASQQQLNRALEQNSQLVEAYVEMGRNHRLKGELGAAAAAFTLALERFPEHFEARRQLARTHELLQRDQEAYLELLRLQERYPNRWQTFDALGSYHLRRGDRDQALNAYQQALELSGRAPAVLANLAAALTHLGDSEGAQALYQEALEYGEDYELHFNLATLHFYQKAYPDAVVHYRRAAELAPARYPAWASLGLSLRLQHGEQDDGSRQALENALRIAQAELSLLPSDRTLLGQVAIYHAYLGQGEDARRFRDRLLALGTVSASSAFLLADLSYQLGEEQQALAWIETAMEQGVSLAQIERYPMLAPLRHSDGFRKLTQP
ncbi:serine/threonine-protein kinase [Ferrimonas marina]|uniref:Serine/threonine protein kinase n=1 Tax=Ferrimonas marina TaxID=299255 RepID=A0A1M5NLK5_9GAMM|nr:serine/threonine-protein kinase [Ferrimonas marina]SHG90388.1 serine/threonine protein kinase [Ferrimonas marina]